MPAITRWTRWMDGGGGGGGGNGGGGGYGGGGGRRPKGRCIVEKVLGEQIEVKTNMIVSFLYRRKGSSKKTERIDEVNGINFTVCCKEEENGIKKWNGRFMFCSTKGTNTSRVETIMQDEALKARMESEQRRLNDDD